MSAEPAMPRINVVVLGLEDSEKTQIARQLCQGDNVSGWDSTASNNPHKCIVKVEDVTYGTTVLDAPGLSRDPNGNTSVIKTIKELIASHFQDLHLVIFVVGYRRVTEDTRIAIDQFFKNTSPNISDLSAIVFSGCSETVEAQKDYEQFFKKQVSWSSKAKLGLYYVDFQPIDNLTELAKKDAKDRIKSDRKSLQELLGKASGKAKQKPSSTSSYLNTERSEPSTSCMPSCLI